MFAANHNLIIAVLGAVLALVCITIAETMMLAANAVTKSKEVRTPLYYCTVFVFYVAIVLVLGWKQPDFFKSDKPINLREQKIAEVASEVENLMENETPDCNRMYNSSIMRAHKNKRGLSIDEINDIVGACHADKQTRINELSAQVALLKQK